MEIFWYALFLGVCVGLSWVFLYAFSGVSVKLGGFCRAWMPGLDVNSVEVGEAVQSNNCVRDEGRKAKYQFNLKMCFMH